jgi:hypothetical protein
MNNRLVLLISVCLCLVACQEKIDIDLNSKSPKVVIEANMPSQGQSAFVLLSQTSNYNDTSYFKGLSGAVVTISDGAGVVDTLQEAFTGFYTAVGVYAQAGETYRLKVEVNGATYEAVSEAHPPVPLDSVYGYIGGFNNDTKRVGSTFFDPKDTVNYYKADIFVNGKLRPGNHITNDQFTDGQKRTINFRVDDPGFESGDTVDIYLESIDKNVYQYFYTLSVNTSSQSASPANPVSNISNGALGYFNAYTSSTKRLIYP